MSRRTLATIAAVGLGVLAIAIAVSLVVSFTLTPMMSARWLRREDLSHEASTREHGIYARIEGIYLAMLDWSMHHRWVIVTAMPSGTIESNAMTIAVTMTQRCAIDQSSIER